MILSVWPWTAAAKLAASYLFVLAEAAIVLALLALAWRFGRPHRARLARIERAWVRLARHRRRAVLAVGLSALVARAALLPWMGPPEPVVMDEFAHLLAADTFAHGRASNPAHPLWPHFEAMHVNPRPTYQSMFPPGQGLVLALGKLAGGHPWAGVLASVALLCAALCWMLQGWLPAGWALLGGVLAVLRLGVFGYWINSYWGGALAATGGALVLGALPRMLRALRAVGTPRDPGLAGQARRALPMAAGLALLAVTRPFEGALAALPAAAVLGAAFVGTCGAVRLRLAAGVVLPLGVALSATAAMVGYYNWRGTGDALTMPQQVNWSTYRWARQFLWQTPLAEPPHYRHATMRRFYRWELEVQRSGMGPAGFATRAVAKLRTYWFFFVGPALTLPLLWLPWLLRDRRVRLPLATCGLVAAGVLAESWGFPHYWAPMTGALYLLLLQAMRHLRASGRRTRRPWGRPLALGMVAACLAVGLARGLVVPWADAWPSPPSWPMLALDARQGGPTERARVLQQLAHAGGPQVRHLVIVRYGPDTGDHGDGWIYNDADIDAAPVVWAREMDAASNAALLAHFAGRRAWLLRPGADKALSPYPVDAVQSGAPASPAPQADACGDAPAHGAGSDECR